MQKRAIFKVFYHTELTAFSIRYKILVNKFEKK